MKKEKIEKPKLKSTLEEIKELLNDETIEEVIKGYGLEPSLINSFMKPKGAFYPLLQKIKRENIEAKERELGGCERDFAYQHINVYLQKEKDAFFDFDFNAALFYFHLHPKKDFSLFKYVCLVILSELIYLAALCVEYPAKTDGYGDELRDLEKLKEETRQFLRIHYSLNNSDINKFLERRKKSGEKDFYSYILDEESYNIKGNKLRVLKSSLESLICFDNRLADFDAIEASKKHCLEVLLKLADLFKLHIVDYVKNKLTTSIKCNMEA